MEKNIPDVPKYITVSVCWKCNYRCPACHHGHEQFKDLVKKRTPFMRFDKFKRIVDEFAPHKTKIGIYSVGENFFHPEIYTLIEYAQQSGTPIEIDTNGSVMDPVRLAKTGVSDVIVSIDGFSQESYETYRINGNFQNALKRVTALAEEVEKNGGKTNIILKYLVNRFTEDEIEKAAAYYNALPNVTFKLDFFHPPIPADMYLKSRFICPIDSYDKWRPRKRTEFDLYDISEDGRFAVHKTFSTPLTCECNNLFDICNIDTDGSVYPCRISNLHQNFFFGRDDSYFGNAFTDGGVLPVFHGERATRFRENYLKHNGAYSICATCEINRAKPEREAGAEAVEDCEYETMVNGLKTGTKAKQ